MPTVAFVSSKGGTGKTTAALLLALGLESRGFKVAILDCDPNLPLFSWRRIATETTINVFPATTLAEVINILPMAKAKWDYVIIDTEGSVRGRTFIQDATPDLAIIPVGPSVLEVVEAIRTSEFLKKVPGPREPYVRHGCLLTRVPAALKPRSLSMVVAQIKEHRISLLDTAVVEKEAYRAIFAVGGTLTSMDPRIIGGLEGAKANADHYAGQVLALFKGVQSGHKPPSAAAAATSWTRQRPPLNFAGLEGLPGLPVRL